jgi:hypothetical protein
MMRFNSKTRRNWFSVAVPALVMTVAVLVLGIQAFSAPSGSDLQAPQGTARVTADMKDSSANPAYSEVMTMNQWQYTQGPNPPPPPPTVPGTGFKF